MNKLTQLQIKITEAVPEIKKWRDGALVHFEWYDCHIGESGSDVFTNEPEEFGMGIILGDEILGCEFGEGLQEKEFKNGVYEVGRGDVYEYVKGEIQPRDISLEDVLMTIETEPKIYESYEYYNVLKQLMDYLPEKGGWQLNKPLHEQSIPTINFLHNLLCLKK